MNIETSMLSLFIGTFFFVSITPGMCMTLSLTLGMTIGVRRTMWMMIGELLGVGLVAVASVVGIAAVILTYPHFFAVFKICGAIYLAWLGIQMWRSKGKLVIPERVEAKPSINRQELMLQGFVTAVANPKGWAFLIALLPPFVDPEHALGSQLAALVLVILMLEFFCLMIYAIGGFSLSHLLRRQNNIKVMNRIAGGLMVGVSVWLVTS